MTWKDLTEEDIHNMKQLEAPFRYTKEEMLHAVKDEDWQERRMRLKGLSTSEKLQALIRYLNVYHWTNERRIQVNNYLDALRRGGQLPPRER